MRGCLDPLTRSYTTDPKSNPNLYLAGFYLHYVFGYIDRYEQTPLKKIRTRSLIRVDTAFTRLFLETSTWSYCAGLFVGWRSRFSNQYKFGFFFSLSLSFFESLTNIFSMIERVKCCFYMFQCCFSLYSRISMARTSLGPM